MAFLLSAKGLTCGEAVAEAIYFKVYSQINTNINEKLRTICTGSISRGT